MQVPQQKHTIEIKRPSTILHLQQISPTHRIFFVEYKIVN